MEPRPTRSLPALGLFGALLLAPSAALGWCRTTTVADRTDPLACSSEGVAVAWPYGCAALHLDPRLPPATLTLEDLRRVTRASVDAWTSAACDPAGRTHPGFRLQLLGDLAVAVGYFPDAPNANTVSVPAAWGDDAFHVRDAAALTVVTFAGDRADVLDADVELNVLSPTNPAGMSFSADGSDPRATDLQTALTHELGHALGLAHSRERSAVMWAAVGLGERRRAPTADDEGGVCAAYPPRDVSTCDPALNGITLHGRGATCAAGPRPSSAAPWAAALAALIASQRRRNPFAGAARRRPRSAPPPR